MAILPLSVAGREAPDDFSGTSSNVHESGQHFACADVEENLVGKLAAWLAERGDSGHGDREVQELVERELAAYRVDLGMEREGDEEDDAGKMVKTRGR